MIAVINVKLYPVANFTADTVCKGGTTTFNQTASIGSGTIQIYNWDFGDFTSYSTANSNPTITHVYPHAGTYTVSFTVTSDQGCVTTVVDSVLVGNVPNGVITSDGPLQVCFGGNVTLSAASGYTYVWSTGSTDQRITVDTTGNYGVIITDPVSGCADTAEADVVVFAGTPATVINDTSVSAGGEVILTSSGGVSYSWLPVGGLDNPAVANPVASPDATTTYTVTVTDANGCTSTDSVTVSVTSDYYIKIPNLITPNGDGHNDTWIIGMIEKYPGTEVIVVNIEGKEVFHSTDYQNEWGGTNMSGKPLPDGTYYYFIQFKDSEIYYKGAVTILNNGGGK